MSKTGIKMNWGGFDKMLERGLSDIGNTQKLMTNIGQAMKGQTKRRFAESESPEGEKWAELKKPRQRGSKAKARPLVDTGRLRDSISFSATPFEVHVGSNLVQARRQQLGGDGITARPYLGLSEKDGEEIEDLVTEHIEESFS